MNNIFLFAQSCSILQLPVCAFTKCLYSVLSLVNVYINGTAQQFKRSILHTGSAPVFEKQLAERHPGQQNLWYTRAPCGYMKVVLACSN